MDEESANKFISALIKSVQTLCHGYVDFSNGVEIIGHINLNIDKGSSFDYILKEKVCRNDENSTLFISNSFHAQPKGEQAFKPNSVQSETHVSHRRHSTDTSESNKLSSVISSISTALSGSHSQTKSRSGSRDNLTNTHQSHPVQSTAKRKAEDDISSDLHPVKSASISRHDSSSGHQHFFTSQSPSHPSGSNSPIDSKASFIPCVGDSSQRTSTSLSDDVHSHVTATMLPQTASITSDNQSDIGVNLEGSVLERIDDRSNSETHDKDDSDLDLEVTFIKEEYVEGDRSACEFQNSSGNQALNRASNQRASSDGVQDPPLYPVALHTNASATYVPSSHEIAAMAHYAAAGAIQQNSMGMPGSSQPQPGPSGLGQSGMRDPSSVTQGFPWSYLAAANTLGGQSAVGKVHQSGTQDFQQPGPTSRRNLHIPASLQHFQLMGDCSRPEMLKCNLCDATFRSASGLSGHRRRVHMKKSVYTCNICGMGFTMRGHFVGHMNMHNKVKAFKCPHCPRAFAYRTSLKSHLRLSLCGRQSPSTSAA